MQQDRFLLLLSRKFAGESTARESVELEQLMRQQPDLRALATQFPQHRMVNSESDNDEAEAAFAAHAVKMQLSGRMDASSPHRIIQAGQPVQVSGWNRKLGALLACSLVMLALAIMYIDKQKKHPAVANNEVTTRNGATSTLQLPDGTRVWLNADSKLVYPETFVGQQREVTLSGEAYFDVSSNNLHPFVIHTEKLNIQVLGTAFNVKSYPQDDIVEATLVRGKIAVSQKDLPAEKVILTPNQKLTFNKADILPRLQVSNLQPTDGSLMAETAWVQHKMVFNNTSLASIAQILERRFNVQFVFDNESVKSYTYTGSYENEDLDEILKVLQLCRKFSYTKSGNEIRIGR